MKNTKAKSPQSCCRALTHIRVNKIECPVVPVAAVIGLVILIMMIIAGLTLSEWFIRSKGGAGAMKHKPSPAWERENAIINENNRGKIQTADFWHSRAHPYRPKSKSKRILVMGDSFVWGDGNANMNEIWWRQLQWELNRRGYWDLDVIGSGSYGGSTEGEFHALRDLNLIEKSGADVVIVGYVTNDPIMTSNRIRQLSGQARATLSAEYRSTLIDRLISPLFPVTGEILQDRIVNKKFYRKRAGPDVAFPYGIWELKLLQDKNLQLYRQLLADFGKFMRSKDLPFFVMTLPNTPLKKQYSIRYKPLGPLFKEAGIPFHNILEDFLKKYPGVIDARPWYVNPANGHPGPSSTYFYAQRAADTLEEDYSEALGDRSPAPANLEPHINDWVPYNLSVNHVRDGQWTIRFPTNQMMPLYMPLEKPHVMLSFKYPVSATRITIMGDTLKGADVHVEAIDGVKGYNTGKLHHLGAQTGETFSWDIRDRPFSRQITALRIVPSLSSQVPTDGHMGFKLSMDGAAVEMSQ
jgi:hypothetical protein